GAAAEGDEEGDAGDDVGEGQVAEETLARAHGEFIGEPGKEPESVVGPPPGPLLSQIRAGIRLLHRTRIQEALMQRKWWTLLAVTVATFMLLLDITVVNVALPSIRESLHASFGDLQWVVDAYSLTLAALVLTAGSLADRFGRRRVFEVGLA